MKRAAIASILLLTLLDGSSAHASPKADIELDPLAYALGGSSVHGGIQLERFRLDLGAFSLDVPEAFHGNTDFALSMVSSSTTFLWRTALASTWARKYRSPNPPLSKVAVNKPSVRLTLALALGSAIGSTSGTLSFSAPG